jgi:hypothetical protein
MAGDSVKIIGWVAAASTGAGAGVADVPHPARKKIERSRIRLKIRFILKNPFD